MLRGTFSFFPPSAPLLSNCTSNQITLTLQPLFFFFSDFLGSLLFLCVCFLFQGFLGVPQRGRCCVELFLACPLLSNCTSNQITLTLQPLFFFCFSPILSTFCASSFPSFFPLPTVPFFPESPAFLGPLNSSVSQWKSNIQGLGCSEGFGGGDTTQKKKEFP